MWVFGYGSLMWDRWEQNLGCLRTEQAVLAGYRRSFNKKSVRNWGTGDAPCPTLGLSQDDEAECVGLGFEFPDPQRQPVYDYLAEREGPSFTIEQSEIRLQSGIPVIAAVPINDEAAETYIGDLPAEERAKLVRAATGTCGNCFDYVDNIRGRLVQLGIIDPAVEEFWRLVSP